MDSFDERWKYLLDIKSKWTDAHWPKICMAERVPLLREKTVTIKRVPVPEMPKPGFAAQSDFGGAELTDFGLTVSECLAIPPLTRASVAGGAAGLSRRARWVHVIDHDDIEDSLTGNELILSSGVSLGHNRSLQRSIFPIMERRASAGLILSLGSYIPEMPEDMIRDAESFGIPLITMPWEVNFRDITQVLLTRIVRDQFHLLESAESINRSLLRIALNRGTLDALCDRLAEATGRRVAVVGPNFDILAVDPAGKADPHFPQLFVASFPRQSRNADVETIVTPDGRWAIKAPIIVTSRLQGFIILDAGFDKPERFEAMIVESATLVAALLIAQTEEIERIQTSRERDSFVALVEGSQDPAKIAALGPIAPGPYSLMVLDIEGGAVGADRILIRRALEQTAPHARLSEYAQQFIVLLPHSRRYTPRAIATKALDRIAHARPLNGIGLSRPFAALATVRDAYAEAQEAMTVGRALDPDAKIHVAEDSAALRPFLRALPTDPADGFGRIGLLAQHDAAHGSDLIRTLDHFLSANQNTAIAARKLGIHRHTLAYRLERIVDLLGIELTTGLALDLRLQLIAYRMASFVQKS